MATADSTSKAARGFAGRAPGGRRETNGRSSSGHDLLDEAATRAVRAITSVPIPPAAIGWRTPPVLLPIVYRRA